MKTKISYLLICVISVFISDVIYAQTEHLEVEGSIKIGDSNTQQDGTIRYNGSDFQGRLNNTWHSLTQGGTTGTSPWVTSGTNLYNSNAGNIGIGTMSPQDELHISGNGHLLTLEGTTTSYMQFYPEGFAAGRKGWIGFGSTANDILVTNQHTDGRIIFKTNGFNRVYLTDAGLLGINRPTPQQRLHVGGKIRSSYTSTSGEYTEIWHGGGNGFINTAGDGNLDFRHDNVTMMSVLPTGQVTIGTVATPGNYNLYVENGILTEEVKVALESSTDWSDDAFYRLPSIDEMESSIQNNSHLYGMPSANELVKTGYSVTDMDSKLLAQIEWQWMYMIKQKEVNQKLLKQNQSLEQRLEVLEKMILSKE